MESKQIEEGNKLIAEFMGFKWKSFNGAYNIFKVPEAEELKYQAMSLGGNKMPYYSSWDWLMPVVEKISRIEFERRYDEDAEKWVIWTHRPVTFGMLDERGRPMVRFYCNTLHFGDTLIQAAWNAVVDFIKWNNEQSLSLTKTVK